MSHVMFHPAEPGMAFATQFGGLVRSADDGIHWQLVDTGSGRRFWPSELVILTAEPKRIFALLPRHGVVSGAIGPDVATTATSSGR